MKTALIILIGSILGLFILYVAARLIGKGIAKSIYEEKNKKE